MWIVLIRILALLGLAAALAGGIAVEKGKPQPQEEREVLFCGSCPPPSCEYPPCTDGQ